MIIRYLEIALNERDCLDNVLNLNSVIPTSLRTFSINSWGESFIVSIIICFRFYKLTKSDVILSVSEES